MLRELAEAEFEATFVSPMRRLAIGEIPPVRVSLKDYVSALIATNSLPTTNADIQIHRVYVADGEKHTHVLFYFGEPNTYLALVVDNVAANVLGHRILDFAKMYGLKD